MKSAANDSEDSIYTQAVHAGEDSESHLGALSTPIYNASVFEFPDAEQGAAIHDNEQDGYFYGRIANPTQNALETALCELENGAACLSFASGMAAISATMLTLLKSGDHIVAPESLYASTDALFNQMLEPFGIATTYVDARNAENYEAAIRPETKVLYIESPANPTLKLVDMKAVAAIAKNRGLVTVMDNTFATPFNQRPLDFGVDVVVHSATKYLGGHGDLMAGAIIVSSDAKEIAVRARHHTNKILGGVISANTAWLVLRGIKTLALRMERHNSNALEVAEFLESCAKVKAVHYPHLESHQQFELAKRQMPNGGGGMIAFDVGDVEAGRKLVNNVKLCKLAVSLGDVATLIQHSASMTHASVPREKRLSVGITDGLLRLSVGIERAADIIDDLERALSQL